MQATCRWKNAARKRAVRLSNWRGRGVWEYVNTRDTRVRCVGGCHTRDTRVSWVGGCQYAGASVDTWVKYTGGSVHMGWNARVVQWTWAEMRGWFSERPEEEEHCAHASDNKSWLAVFGVVYNVIIHNVEFHLRVKGGRLGVNGGWY